MRPFFLLLSYGSPVADWTADVVKYEKMQTDRIFSICGKKEENMRKWIACLLVIMLAAAAFGTVLADPEKPEWEYSAKDAKITKYNGPGGDVVVPAEIDGNPVIFIDGSTFPSSREDITSITFSNGIEGFYNVLNTTYSLEQIVLPDTLEVIGNGALGYCPKLKEINFPEGLETIGSMAFKGCGS